MTEHARTARRPSGGGERTLTIGALSRATHIPVETLRTWERRYGAPRPLRKPSGHRLYPASTVEHLRRVERLLAQGHRAGQILTLPPDALEEMLELGTRSSTPLPEPVPVEGASAERSIRILLRAAQDLDRDALLHELRAAWVRFGPIRFLDEIAGRFLTEIGAAWARGEADVRHEHLASACMSDFLRAVREPYDQRARGPRVVAAILPEETHDGGLLLVSALLALRGRRVVYLGTATPVAEIAAAARSTGAEGVVVSVSAAMPPAVSAPALDELRRALPQRLALWTGGAGAPEPSRGIERFTTLAALDARLG
jgi:methanogenic corrinoid protein MtbC1